MFKRLLFLIISATILVALYGCHAGGSSPMAPDNSAATVLPEVRTVDANGRFTDITFPSGAVIKCPNNDTFKEGVKVTASEQKIPVITDNSGKYSYIYVYNISAVLPSEHSLTSDVPVNTIEKPLSVTLPNNNTAGTCYIGTRASESDPWRYSLVTDGTNSNARFMRLSAKPPKFANFNLFRLNVLFRLFAFDNESSDKGEVGSVALSTGSEDNKITAKDGKYAEDLQIKVTLRGDKLDSFNADGLAARIIYRSQNQTPAQLKANGSIVKQTDSDDKAVTGGYEHSFEITNITVDSQMSGEAVLSFVLNLNGVSIEDFPTDFLVEFYSDTKDEKTLPFTYTQLFSFAAKEEQVNPDPEPEPEPEPEPGYYTLALNCGTGIASVEGKGNYKPDESVTVKCNIKDGYEFDSWSGDKTGNTIELTFKMPENNVTLTANAKLITYNIVYDLAGGALAEGETNPTAYDITSATITLNEPTKNCYTFTGWTGSNGDTPEKSLFIVQGSKSDRNYKANFTPTNFTITYKNSDGSDLTTTNPTSYNVESDKITLTDPTRTGCEFLGWTYEGQTTLTKEVKIDKGSTGDKTFTAHFNLPITLAIAADDGVVIDDVNNLYYTKATFTITPTLAEGVTMTDTEKANILSVVSVKDAAGTSFGNATATWNNDGKIALSFLKELTASTTYTISFGDVDEMTITCEPKTFKTFYFKGKGADDNRFQIESAEQLDYVRNYLDKHFVQTADIDLGAYTTKWSAIGSQEPFVGSYYGNGYKIKNLTIHTSESIGGAGLFYAVGDPFTNKAGKIASITVDGVSIRGINANEPINCPVGIIALALTGDNSSIIDCAVTNSSNTKSEIISHSVGGICLSNPTNNCNNIIQSCIVENCVFKYSTQDQSVSIAGICNRSADSTIIDSCHVENVNISCENFDSIKIAGISLSNSNNIVKNCSVKNSKIICETTADNSRIEIGGICITNVKNIDGCSLSNTTIKAVSTKSCYIGGICCNQDVSGNSLKNSYVENSVLTASGTEGNIGGIVASAAMGIDGTIDNCYISGTKIYGQDLKDGNSYLDVGGIIGSSGNNNTIKNCYATNSTVHGNGFGAGIGGICGSIEYGNGSSITSCYITGCIISSEDNDNEVGGICGYNSKGSISSSYVTGSSSISGGGTTGGICGSINEGLITFCYVSGSTISSEGSNRKIGGIGGITKQCSITSCYITDSTISGKCDYSYISGIGGYSECDITSCYVKDTDISNTGNQCYIGGLCGLLGNNGKITACYLYESDNTHNITSSGNNCNLGYLVGKINDSSSIVQDCFTNLSGTLVGKNNGGSTLNIYGGITSLSDFTTDNGNKRVWSDDLDYRDNASFNDANSVWKDYDFSSFPPTLGN